jgi:hypothetical protein
MHNKESHENSWHRRWGADFKMRKQLFLLLAIDSKAKTWKATYIIHGHVAKHKASSEQTILNSPPPSTTIDTEQFSSLGCDHVFVYFVVTCNFFWYNAYTFILSSAYASFIVYAVI